MGTVKNPGQNKAKEVEQLNAFLRGELAAVATYKLALDNLERGTKARTNLEACLQSHQQRVSVLRAAIEQMGGVPAQGSAAWDTVVTIVEGTAESFGDRAAIAALEECEDHSLTDYQRDVTSLGGNARQLVEMQLLPRQIETHHTMSELKKQLH